MVRFLLACAALLSLWLAVTCLFAVVGQPWWRDGCPSDLRVAVAAFAAWAALFGPTIHVLLRDWWRERRR